MRAVAPPCARTPATRGCRGCRRREIAPDAIAREILPGVGYSVVTSTSRTRAPRHQLARRSAFPGPSRSGDADHDVSSDFTTTQALTSGGTAAAPCASAAPANGMWKPTTSVRRWRRWRRGAAAVRVVVIGLPSCCALPHSRVGRPGALTGAPLALRAFPPRGAIRARDGPSRSCRAPVAMLDRQAGALRVAACHHLDRRRTRLYVPQRQMLVIASSMSHRGLGLALSSAAAPGSCRSGRSRTAARRARPTPFAPGARRWRQAFDVTIFSRLDSRDRAHAAARRHAVDEDRAGAALCDAAAVLVR